MSTKLNLTVDEVLSTTRAVRRRLDVTRPVPRAVLEECLELALQAPNGANRNEWRWIIVDDPDLIGKLATEYRTAMGIYRRQPDRQAGADRRRAQRRRDCGVRVRIGRQVAPDAGHPDPADARASRGQKPSGAVPDVGFDPAGRLELPARPARARPGIRMDHGRIAQGDADRRTARHPRQIDYTQVGMFPIAYTIGTDFQKVYRKPVSEVLSYNNF